MLSFFLVDLQLCLSDVFDSPNGFILTGSFCFTLHGSIQSFFNLNQIVVSPFLGAIVPLGMCNFGLTISHVSRDEILKATVGTSNICSQNTVMDRTCVHTSNLCYHRSKLLNRSISNDITIVNHEHNSARHFHAAFCRNFTPFILDHRTYRFGIICQGFFIVCIAQVNSCFCFFLFCTHIVLQPFLRARGLYLLSFLIVLFQLHAFCMANFKGTLSMLYAL